jgi:hypothetical protein
VADCDGRGRYCECLDEVHHKHDSVFRVSSNGLFFSQ